MKQQVNLYQPIFRQQEKVFSAITMLQITAFFVVVLGAIYAYTTMQLQPFSDELEKANVQFEKLSSQIEVLSKQFSFNHFLQRGKRLKYGKTACSENLFCLFVKICELFLVLATVQALEIEGDTTVR